jgi:hypothetical protein
MKTNNEVIEVSGATRVPFPAQPEIPVQLASPLATGRAVAGGRGDPQVCHQQRAGRPMNASFPSAYREQGRREGYVRADVAGWPVYFERAIAWDDLKDRLRALARLASTGPSPQ